RLIATDSEDTREWMSVQVTPTIPGDDDGEEPGEPGDSAGIPIHAEVPDLGNGEDDGSLTLSVDDFGDAVDLGRALNAGDRFRFAGELPTVSVSDSRGAESEQDGWSVSGQSTDFTHSDGELGASHLGWVPGQIADKVGVSPGAAVAGERAGGLGL